MRLLMWFLIFSGTFFTTYITFKLGKIAGFHEAMEITDRTIDEEIRKRWDKINEDRPD